LSGIIAKSLLVIFPDGLYAVMELKFDVGKSMPRQARLVAGLAGTALSRHRRKRLEAVPGRGQGYRQDRPWRLLAWPVPGLDV
jgi:hypothetical protein